MGIGADLAEGCRRRRRAAAEPSAQTRPGALRPVPPPVPTGVSGAEARRPGKASHFSVNWAAGAADLEVLDATTGRRRCGGASRLCKHALSSRWARLHGKVGDGAPSRRVCPGGGGTKLAPGRPLPELPASAGRPSGSRRAAKGRTRDPGASAGRPSLPRPGETQGGRHPGRARGARPHRGSAAPSLLSHS